MSKIITIDGPSGVGKGTLARSLAMEFDFELLDSGAIYRLGALYSLDQGIYLENVAKVVMALQHLEIAFKVKNGHTKAYLQGKEVSDRLRLETTGMAASKIAKFAEVRDALMQKQQDFANKGRGLVADGRDMGTVVFPQAEHKFFLEASGSVRAKRRFEELAKQGMHADYNEILKQVEQRDEQDRNRKVAPLRPANDAIIIDTSKLSIYGVFQKVLKYLK